MKLQKILLEQNKEVEVTRLPMSRGYLRYAFARATETQAANENSQDSLCIVKGGDLLCFALCDGVSMSFMGDISSHFLCQQLTQWLVDFNSSQKEHGDMEPALESFLAELIVPATTLVNEYKLPDEMTPILKSVLEEKRALGSESMFICGLFDARKDSLHLVWMGDSRLYIWPPSYHHTRASFKDSFQTHDRWSSCRGPIGKIHTMRLMLSSVERLAVYSDGLAVLDGKMNTPLEDAHLNKIIQTVGESPTSDDISFFEIQLSAART